jgi:hypothetical protein
VETVVLGQAAGEGVCLGEGVDVCVLTAGGAAEDEYFLFEVLNDGLLLFLFNRNIEHHSVELIEL